MDTTPWIISLNPASQLQPRAGGWSFPKMKPNQSSLRMPDLLPSDLWISERVSYNRSSRKTHFLQCQYGSRQFGFKFWRCYHDRGISVISIVLNVKTLHIFPRKSRRVAYKQKNPRRWRLAAANQPLPFDNWAFKIAVQSAERSLDSFGILGASLNVHGVAAFQLISLIGTILRGWNLSPRKHVRRRRVPQLTTSYVLISYHNPQRRA